MTETFYIAGYAIVSVQEGDSFYVVTLEEGGRSVPKDPRNADNQMLQLWLAAGGTTTPYVPE
jgi:hypothetical protein